MKTLRDQIAVMTHFMNSGEIECLPLGGSWMDDKNPNWNFDYNSYRIKEQPEAMEQSTENIYTIFIKKDKTTNDIQTDYNAALAESKIQANEINFIIKKRIDNFKLNVDVNEIGKIISYADGVAQVYGLKNVMNGEVVQFENGERGLAFNLKEAYVDIVILGRGTGLREGTSCKRLSQKLSHKV